eukprot:Gregarina_sp_Poly_1__1159@NODE_1283_length_4498_cov_151_782668_g869_i0_p3_GENE_NODE_1283_length_4498_cov_151_782668_g869_i0NODE_1283_length_4498_cov_151_782668_g869_i0_p3_ORF_typecomplete_len159_score18_43Mito_carr/PF00153_27/0_25Mito_carr/PF00153_27/3_2e08_NODE_1283_length_4498_cov_151_782668_g869_i0156632
MQLYHALRHKDIELLRQRYRGVGSMLCTIPTGVLQMMIYEKLRKVLSPSSDTNARISNLLRSLCWSTGSKIAAAGITYPLLVVRFYQQFPELLGDTAAEETSRRSSGKTVRLLIEDNGISSLFKGFWNQLQKSLLQNVLTLALYESLLQKDGKTKVTD